jgi:hypothetical protein
MNDPRELKLGRELIRKRLKRAIRQLPHKVTKTFFHALWSNFEKHFADRSTCFAISFSERPDLHSQWRDYAANGAGFVLDWSANSELLPAPLRTWVTYSRRQQTDLIDTLTNLHLKWMGRSVISGSRAPVDAFAEAGLSLAIFLYILLQTFKSEEWMREREFRYVHQRFEGHLPAAQIVKARIVGGVERQYVEVDFSSVALRRVIVGPGNTFVEASAWLRPLLDSSGFAETTIMPAFISPETD